MIQSIAFFGIHCDFADRVLDALVRHGYSIAARVVPGQRPEAGAIHELPTASRARFRTALPVLQSSHASLSRRSSNWPTLEINDHSSAETVRTLKSLDADLVVACCYPRRIPLALVNTAALGGVNVHPSLLPLYRGPDPLFWVYRNGDTESGVTVHRISNELDTGEIIQQRRFEIPVGAPGDETWISSADIGANVLLDSIVAIEAGQDVSTPQDESAATYQTWPKPGDLLIEPGEWDAWRLFHFCRGVIPLGHMPRILDEGHVRRVIEAAGYTDGSGTGGERVNGTESVTCRSGEVNLRLGPAIF